jgi:hypothetical protein
LGNIAEGRRKSEEGRRKSEDAIKSTVSAIKNVNGRPPIANKGMGIGEWGLAI